MKHSVHEDRHLLSRCLDGDREAAELFVRRFSDLIYHAVRHTLTSKDVPFSKENIEDLHNTIFLHLFENRCRKLSQYQGKNGASLASWLKVVSVRTVLNHMRGSAHRTLWQDRQISFENLSDQDREALGPLASMEKTEQRRLLQSAIQRLSPRHRLFMRLFFEEGLQIEEVAESLGISIQNAYTVKHRAVQKLKSYLNMKKIEKKL